MKHKLLLIILSLLTLSVLIVSPVEAFDPFPNDAVDCNNAKMKDSSVCNTSDADPLTGADGILLKIVNIMAYIGGVAAIILIIVSGISFMTSGGDSNKAANARRILIDTVIGLLIIILAKAIITFVVIRL